MNGILIDNLSDIKKHTKKCVVLYSGGLDSTYFLHWAVENKLDVIALHIHLGPDSYNKVVENLPQQIGIKYHCFEVIDICK